MSGKWTEYRLTDEEVDSIMQALRYAQDNAVHSDGELKFIHANRQIIKQSDHHARDKDSTSERFEDER